MQMTLMIFPRMSLHWNPVAVQYREYENDLLGAAFLNLVYRLLDESENPNFILSLEMSDDILCLPFKS